MNFVLSNFQRWYSFSHLEVANSFTMFILSFGGASLAILRNRLTNFIIFNINNTVDSCKEGSSCLGIMPVHTEQFLAEIRNFNGYLHCVCSKLKLHLFHIMTSISQILVFLLVILLQCISKDSTSSWVFNIFYVYDVTFCLRTHTSCCLYMLQIQTSP